MILSVNNTCVFWLCYKRALGQCWLWDEPKIITLTSKSSRPMQAVYDKGEIYSFSKHGRFCHEIKMNYSPYTNYFTRVFWNRSYHVYKVNAVISFQYWKQLLAPCWDFTELDSALLQCFTSDPQCDTGESIFAVCGQINVYSLFRHG